MSARTQKPVMTPALARRLYGMISSEYAAMTPVHAIWYPTEYIQMNAICGYPYRARSCVLSYCALMMVQPKYAAKIPTVDARKSGLRPNLSMNSEKVMETTNERIVCPPLSCGVGSFD